MPDSRHKYLYERLGDHDFQQLIGALLTLRFPDFVPLPLRQPDGGRDGVQIDPARRVVYQVKWSVTGTEKKPLGWLTDAVQAEADNIRHAAADGVRKYVLVTNVPSTGTRGTGTFDQLNAKFAEYSREFGLQMEPLWREAVNAMVDNAPTETKWAYAEMLAGWDLVRYLVSEQVEARQESALRSLLRQVAATQWSDDSRIKFSQVELEREYLTDLFVDVAVDRLAVPHRARQISAGGEDSLGGAASYILRQSPYPFTLVLGAPGQGKSTLGQLVCQAHRAAFMPEGTDQTGLPPIEDPRFPLRLDLGDYAAWVDGVDVFDRSESQEPIRGRRRAATQATIECFIAELMTHAAGGDTVTPGDVRDLLDRVPNLVVLDGLDEVGSVPARSRIVKEINLFSGRRRASAVSPRILVTSRPNSAGLAEPDPEMFEVLALSPMDRRLRDGYLRKWCVVHRVRDHDGRALRRNFNEKTREPYIGELAGNPMQLTILLYLLRQQGDATPDQRTELYDAYMGLLLAREANKHPESVRKHRKELQEIVPFLGWHLQSRAEEYNHSGRMSHQEIDVAMRHFQRTYGKREEAVGELLDAASERLWALTSKEQGSYEFDVLSLREYFAARYLWTYAGEGDPRFDRTNVFRELLRRPYWLNTTRFYAGNAAGSDLYILAAGIKHELAANDTSKHVRVAVWSLISDGVFTSRPLEATTIVDALTDDGGAALLLDALDGKEIAQYPQTGHSNAAWQRLTAVIAAAPDDRPANRQLVRTIRDLLGLGTQLTTWWSERMATVAGTPAEYSWLSLGADSEIAAGAAISLPGLRAVDGERAQLLLNCGAAPTDVDAETELVQAVFDGQCSQTTSVRSRPARIAVALGPDAFYAFGPEASSLEPSRSSERRSQAIQQLRRSDPTLAHIAGLRRFRRGEKGTTYPWANVATALLDHLGRCWLATEIAVIGAASPLRNGWTLPRGIEAAFGPASHPVAVMSQTRAQSAHATWWLERLAVCHDDLARAEWAFALWGVAEGSVILELFETLQATVDRLPPHRQRAFCIAAERLGRSGFLRSRPVIGSSDHALIASMLASRETPDSDLAPHAPARPAIPPADPLQPLAVIARRAKWLKVDQMPVYR